MPALTTRDLIGQVITFHRKCVDAYEAAASQAEDYQVTALLKYLAAHERKLAVDIARYLEEASPDLLATWFPFSASLDIEGDLEIAPNADVTTAVDAALKLDERLIAFCRTISDQSATNSVTEVFRSIAALEEATKRRAVTAAVELIED